MAALADCGSGSVGTCLSSLFIMKHNCLENLSHNVYSNESSNLSDAKCLSLDEKAYFSSSRELVVADNGVLSACKNLPDSPDSAICTLDSPEDSDDFKKKRCMDRYDSSESSDSGVLTGSSESSSTGGNSDIADPFSPCSETYYHLSDDNGSSLALPPKSSSYSSSDLLTASKMLPENREEEHDVSCWAWEKAIDWNEGLELTSDEIDVEVKDSVYFNGIHEKYDEENDLEHNMELRPDCYPEDNESKTAVNGKLNFTVPVVERKHLNGFLGKELSARKCCNNGLRAIRKDTSSTDCSVDFALPNNVRNIDASSANYHFEKVFQQKCVTSPASTYAKIPVAESEIHRGKTPQRNDNKSSDITAIETDDNDFTNTCFSYCQSNPIDFFNILPSVFMDPILHSTNGAVDEDSGCESSAEKSCTAVVDHDTQNEPELQCTVSDTRRTTRSDDLFCQTNSQKDVVPDDTVVCSHNNNNNTNNIDKNKIMQNVIPVLRTLKSQDSQDPTSTNVDILPNVDPSPSCRIQTRFPTERNSSFYSERICRWADCTDHVSSRAKLVEHLQAKHVNPQAFSGTFICLWDGCKVFGRASCSRSFLERHVLSHGGNKPYRCIVDNCGQRFSSQLMLERHVNQHFKTPKEITDGYVDATPKLIRRNGQKLRYRRQPFTVRNRGDTFDTSIMSSLHYILVQMARKSKSVSLNFVSGKQFLDVTFQPNVIGSRRERDGQMKYLVRWYPYNSLEDEWLSRSEAEKNKTVPLWELPADVQQVFWDSVLPKRSPAVRQPRKYKPESEQIL